MVREAHNFLDWRGLAWPIEMRGWPLEVRGGSPGRPRALLIKVRDWGAGPAQAENIVSLTGGSHIFNCTLPCAAILPP